MPEISRATCEQKNSWRGRAPATRAAALVLAVGLVLSACGGSAPDSASPKDTSASTSSTSPASRADSALARGAILSSADLVAAEKAAVAQDSSGAATSLDGFKQGQTVVKSAYLSGAVARKALAVRIPVYRFSNSSTGAHFFTTSTTERDNIVATLSPPFSLEGAAFSVASAFSPGLSPVHRFYNTQTGVHFYTISETERANVVATLPHFTYEGVAYHASQVAGLGLIPFYRFLVPSKGFHFYTANEAEKNSIIANLASTYSYEGVGYYVLDTNWTAEKLPHTGITSSQCYAAGSDAMVTCTPTRSEIQAGGTSVNLNRQQDGHRTTVNPMSYSEVANPAGGTYPRTSCVRDNLTGLIWEGKTPTGERAGDLLYTNYSDGTTGDASAYVARVNQLALCGFTDWRLPGRNDLVTIYEYSKTSPPMVNTIWFPNTAADSSYWAAEGKRGDSTQAWYVPFSSHAIITFTATRSATRPVRLVRGSFGQGPRYSYGTLAYGADAAHNLVNDAWTGLQWRRCLQGQTWNGSTCTGSASTYSHEQALAHAQAQTGWRMPNIRELTSLANVDPGQATSIDLTAFPSGLAYVWGATPVPGTSFAWYVDFQNYGERVISGRGGLTMVRLVRAN